MKKSTWKGPILTVLNIFNLNISIYHFSIYSQFFSILYQQSNQQTKNLMHKLLFALTLVFILTHSRNYPMFKQCDSAWRNDQLGTSSNTICSAGCLMCSASMALAGTVKPDMTPAILNRWLTQNGGYVSGDLFVWSAINTFGVTFQGKVPNNQIKANLIRGNIVICNVHNGKHWVIAYGYNGDNILINDPNYTTPSYTLAEIVDGQNGVYSVKSGSYYNLIAKLQALRKQGSSQALSKMADGGTNTDFIEGA